MNTYTSGLIRHVRNFFRCVVVVVVIVVKRRHARTYSRKGGGLGVGGGGGVPPSHSYVTLRDIPGARSESI